MTHPKAQSADIALLLAACVAASLAAARLRLPGGLILGALVEQPVVRRVVGPDELNAPPTLAAKGEFAGANALLLTGVDNASAITGYRLMAFYP